MKKRSGNSVIKHEKSFSKFSDKYERDLIYCVRCGADFGIVRLDLSSADVLHVACNDPDCMCYTIANKK